MTLKNLYKLANSTQDYEEFEVTIKKKTTQSDKDCNILITIHALTETEVYSMWVSSISALGGDENKEE